MLIVCPNCATSYNVDAASLGGAGRPVRCVRCRTVWQARASETQAPSRQTLLQSAKQPAAATGPRFAPPPPTDPEPRPEPSPVMQDTAPPAVIAEEDAPPTAPADDLPMFEAEAPLTPVSGEAPPLVPVDLDNGRLPDIDAEPELPVREDIEAVAARRAAKSRRTRRSYASSSIVLTILGLVAVHAGLIAFRADIVRALPQTGALYAALGLPVNLRGLSFDDLKTTRETHEGVPVLAVAGAVVSHAGQPVGVPRLRFSVRNDSGQEIYAWTALPAKTTLAPGERLTFRSRLASPPAEGHDVLVRFFTRRDVVAGFQTQ